MPVETVSLSDVPDRATHVGIRPEHILLATGTDGHLSGKVDVLEYLGADTFVVMECGDAGQVTVRLTGDTDLAPGKPASLKFLDGRTRFFDRDGQAV